jgi:hypothetical protein
MYENEIKSVVNISVHWVIACSIVGIPSIRNPNSLSWNRVINSIPLDVHLM